MAHNTILNSTQHAINLGLRSPSSKSFIENNLIASVDGAEIVHALGGEGIVWRHNLWSSFPGQNVYNPSNDVVESEVGLVNLNAPIKAGAVTPVGRFRMPASGASTASVPAAFHT